MKEVSNLIMNGDSIAKMEIPALGHNVAAVASMQKAGSKNKKKSLAITRRDPEAADLATLSTTLKSSKPNSVVEHFRSNLHSYLGGNNSMPTSMLVGPQAFRYQLADRSTWHSGVLQLFQELLHNSVDEFLEGHGHVIDVMCSAETITIRDYGRGIPHNRLRSNVLELGSRQKYNSNTVRYCEGFNGLGLKLVNALSSRFLIRSYRTHKFAELESEYGNVQCERRGRCDKPDGVFIRFTPDLDIFGKQAVRIPVICDILYKIVALYPSLEIRLNQNHVITQKSMSDLFQSLPQWRKQNYLYEAQSLGGGGNWQLAFTHLSEWQTNDGGLYNSRLIQSFVNGHACSGGLAGGLHMQQLQGAFLGVLRNVFPEKQSQVNAFWDKGLTLFFGINLIEPYFQDTAKSQLLGSEAEIANIVGECREQLLHLLQQNPKLREQLEKRIDECESAEGIGDYNHWQARLSGELQQVEELARQLDDSIQDSDAKYGELQRNLGEALESSAEIQNDWKEVSSQLTVDIERAENELSEFKKLQRTEQRRYRKEQEKRLANLDEEQKNYHKLKEDLRQQAKDQLSKEGQRQRLINRGIESWQQLQNALEAASELQKQRDLEQEQILAYLRSAKDSTESQVESATQNILLAEQKMLQRQEQYLQNLQENAHDEFDSIHEEIDQRKQDLRTALDTEQQVAYDKLEKLHKQFSQTIKEKSQHWQEKLQEAEQNSEEEWQQNLEQRREELSHLEQAWNEQKSSLEGQRHKQRSFMERWQERLDEGRREAHVHQNAQNELAQNRKELEQFFQEQKSTRDEQAQVWKNWLEESRKNLAESRDFQQQEQESWQKRFKQQEQEMEAARSRQLISLESLGQRLEQKVEQEVQNRLNDWLGNLERLERENGLHFEAKQKLLQTKQQTLENELELVQQEKAEIWTQWQKDFGDTKEEMTAQLVNRKKKWELRQETLLQEFDEHLEKLKQKQNAQQYRIEEAQAEQTQMLKQVQQFQRDADERLNNLNKNLGRYTAELRKEIEDSITELRSNTDHQFAQVEQCTHDQTLLHQQGLMEKEQEHLELFDQCQKDFSKKLEKQSEDWEAWNQELGKRFEEQKQDLRQSLDEFGDDLRSKQQVNLAQQLEQWNDKFLAKQNSKEKQAAQDAQRKRNEFWCEQQSTVQEEVRQQRHEFQELQKELQAGIERERERFNKELSHLQQLTKQQEDSLEALNQSLSRSIEQRAERLKQEMEDNYRQFHEEVLDNTRELHELNSEERRTLRNDLSNMRQDLNNLNATISSAEQTLLELQKALPDSVRLQEILGQIAEKENMVREVEAEILQLQTTLNENNQLGQKTSEQLSILLAKRNELSEMEQQMQAVLQLSGDLYQQRESLDQQQDRVAGYQSHLDKLEYLYSESSDLLELFDERKDQFLEAAELLHNYDNTLNNLDSRIQTMHGQLEPLELGFGKSQELQQELAEQQEQLHSTQKDLAQMHETLAELHEDSQGIDKMREWIAKTETRMLELSQDIQNNLRTVETIVRKNRPNERSAHHGSGKMDNDVRNTVIQLHGKSWSSSEIARATQLSVGEVELILEMLPSAS